MDDRYHIMEEKSLLSYSRVVVESLGSYSTKRLDYDWLPADLRKKIAESCGGDAVCEKPGLSVIDWLRQIRFNCVGDFTDVISLDKATEDFVIEEINDLRLIDEERMNDTLCNVDVDERRRGSIRFFDNDDRRNINDHDTDASALILSFESSTSGELVGEEALRDHDFGSCSSFRYSGMDISRSEDFNPRENVFESSTSVSKLKSNFPKSLSAILETSDEVFCPKDSTRVSSNTEDSSSSRIGRSDVNLIFDNANTTCKPVPPIRRKNKKRFSENGEGSREIGTCEKRVNCQVKRNNEVNSTATATIHDLWSNDPGISQSFLDIPRAVEAESLLNNKSSDFVRKRITPVCNVSLRHEWNPADDIVSFEDSANQSNPEDLLLISRVSHSTKLKRHAKNVSTRATFANDRERTNANYGVELMYKTLPIANLERSYKRNSIPYMGGKLYTSEIFLCSKANTKTMAEENGTKLFCGTDTLNEVIRAHGGLNNESNSPKADVEFVRLVDEPGRWKEFSYEFAVNEELEKLSEEAMPLINADALAKSNPMDDGLNDSEIFFGNEDLGVVCEREGMTSNVVGSLDFGTLEQLSSVSSSSCRDFDTEPHYVAKVFSVPNETRGEITESTNCSSKSEEEKYKNLETFQTEYADIDEDGLSKCGIILENNANLGDVEIVDAMDHRSHLIFEDTEECNVNEMFDSDELEKVNPLERNTSIGDYVDVFGDVDSTELSREHLCISGEINQESDSISDSINEQNFCGATRYVEDVETRDNMQALTEVNLLKLDKSDLRYCEENSKLNFSEGPIGLELTNISGNSVVSNDLLISKRFENPDYDYLTSTDTTSFELIENVGTRNGLNNLKTLSHDKNEKINVLEAECSSPNNMFDVKFCCSKMPSEYFDENKDEKFESFGSEKSFHSALDKISPARSDCEDSCEYLQVLEELAEKSSEESNEAKPILGMINKNGSLSSNILNMSDNSAKASSKNLYVNFPLKGNLENPDVITYMPNKPLRKRLNVNTASSEKRAESKINNNEVLSSLDHLNDVDSNLLKCKSDDLSVTSTIENFVSDDVVNNAIRMRMKFRERKGSASSDIVHWKKCLRDTSLDDEDDWFSSNDAEGKIYFFEENSNESSWVLPNITIGEPSTTSANVSYQDVEVRNISSNEKVRVGKTHSMVLINQSAISQELATRKSSSIPRDWPQLFDGNMCVLMEGTINRTKITENGKKLKKNWSASHVVLTELFLLFFKDAKTFAVMKSGQSPTAKPDISVDLNGALIEPGERASSRKNVYIISTVLGLQVLIQSDNVAVANEWYQAIHTAIRCLPSSFETYEKPSPSIERPHEVNSKTFLDTNSPEETKKCSKVGRSRSVKIKRPDGSLEDLSGTVAERQTKIKAKLRRFFQRRPTVDLLVKNGIYKDEPAFGSYLNDVCPIEPPRVPRFVKTCIEILESNTENMKADGLYRASGNLSQIQKIRLQVDQNNLEILKREDDVHVLTGALKLFFRELKEPLIPFAFFEKALNASMSKKKLEKVQCFREIVKALPATNHDTLQFLLQHLLRVTTYQEYNRMHIPNLAIVFGPTLMWPAEESANMALDLMQQNLVIECFLSEYDRIFK